MKIMIEITGLTSGQSNDKNWVRLTGRDGRGKSVKAVCFDQLADTISKTISKMIPEGAEVASQRLLVDLVGEFRDGKQIIKDGKPLARGDGSPICYRSFYIENFRLLTGPMLEMARMKRDADARLTKAEQLAATGDFTGAYRVLGEFVASICSRPFELVEHNSDDLDDEEFGDTETIGTPTAAHQMDDQAAVNPEVVAAELFAREDAMMDKASRNETKQPVEVSVTPISSVDSEPSEDVLDDSPTASEAVDIPSINPAGSEEKDSKVETNAGGDEPSNEEKVVQAPAPRRQGFGRRF